MRKNYFSRNLIAAMMLSVSSVMVSCSGLIDAVIGTEDIPASPQSSPATSPVTITDEGAAINVSSPSDITKALDQLKSNIVAAAAKGEPLKVTVAGSGVAIDAADQKITIPQNNGADVEIAFAAAPTGTASNALVLEASQGAGEIPGDANNALTVTMPPSEGLALTIELPETTVSLKTDGTGAVVYDDVIAKTAKQTIIINEGVTIKEHELVGGNIVVKKGGAIETIAVTIKDSPSLVCLGSWWSGVWFKENGPEPQYEIRNEDESPYVPKNLILRKGAGDYTSLETRCRADEYVDRVTVDEGVTIAYVGDEMNGQYKNIEGKGNNRLHTRAGLSPEGEYFAGFGTNTELVKNFTIANEIHDVEGLYQDVANLVINFVDSETSSKTFTFDNCNFENSKTQFTLSAKKYKAVIHYMALEEGIDPAAPDAWMHVYDETDLNALLEKGVPNKEVGGGEVGGYWTDERLDEDSLEGQDLTFTLNFKNCTIGGEAITKDKVKFPTWGLWAPGNIKFKVIIDGNTYIATSWYGDDDPRNGEVSLEEITE